MSSQLFRDFFVALKSTPKYNPHPVTPASTTKPLKIQTFYKTSNASIFSSDVKTHDLMQHLALQHTDSAPCQLGKGMRFVGLNKKTGNKVLVFPLNVQQSPDVWSKLVSFAKQTNQIIGALELTETSPGKTFRFNNIDIYLVDASKLAPKKALFKPATHGANTQETTIRQTNVK
jgi:hypothetical protein